MIKVETNADVSALCDFCVGERQRAVLKLSASGKRRGILIYFQHVLLCENCAICLRNYL